METPGFGARHPELAAILSEHQPTASHEVTWGGGTLPLRVSAYTNPIPLPDEIVTSVRCIILVDGLVVLCENPGGSHPWPGGRRLPHESYLHTAAREVHEETGWQIKPESAIQLGWLHLTHLGPHQPDNASPYPDFLQVVFCATASERDGGRDAEWTDVDGYETTSRLVTLDEAIQSVNEPLSQVF